MVKPIIVIRTIATLLLGETAIAVFIRPNTIHGCRPTSVKIQPKELAASGRNGSRIAAVTAPRPGRRPLRIAHRNQAAAKAASVPAPIIQRKVQ